MAALDRAKEKIAYHKFWLGTMVVTEISLVGWLVSGREPEEVLFTAIALAVLVTLIAGILLLHRQIKLLIEQTGTL